MPVKKSAPAWSDPHKKASRSPARKSQPAGRTRAGGGGLTSRASSVTRNAPAPRRQASKRRTRTVLIGLSSERKIDLVGVILAMLGLLTLLSLVSTTHSGLLGDWLGFLRNGFGWGVYLLPLVLLVLGLWLMMRNLERLPQFSIERLVGLLLLFVNFETWLHFLASSNLSPENVSRGGGYVGGFFKQILVVNIGPAGTAIVLVAWTLISLAFTFDIPIPEIFHWIAPVLSRIRLAFHGRPNQLGLGPQPAGSEGEAGGVPARDGFAPFNWPNPFAVSQPGRIGAEREGAPVGGPTQAAVHPPTPVLVSAGETSSGSAPVAQQAAPWVLPPLDQILEKSIPVIGDENFDRQRSHLIEETLKSFGAPAHVVEIHRGPTITQFGVEPDFVESRYGRTRVRVSKIVSLVDDLALALAAQRIRIQAPVPGRAYVGIEVPNAEVGRVALRDVMESEDFQKIRSPLRFTLGKDVSGHPTAVDLAAMPHLLIAGTTGSGKSVCINAILSCFLINNTPDDLRLILVDPKRVELTSYNGIPHLLAPVVVDAERVVGALQWMLREMDNRYHKFAQIGARNISDYNTRLQARGEKRIPYLVVVIDELADLMMMAPDETERTITRLAQLARATGIHLILATQRPSVDVLTGLIKANFPARIAFAVASGVDSRVILDQPGAERLLGRGDMLFQAPDAPAPVRLQGAHVFDAEIQRLVEYWRAASVSVAPEPPPGPPVDSIPASTPLKQAPLWDEMAPREEGDPLLKDAIDLVRREGRASISMLQRRMRIGYTRAARLIDTMEEKGIVGSPQANAQVREVLDYGPTAPPEEK